MGLVPEWMGQLSTKEQEQEMTTLTAQEMAEVAREVMDDGRAIIHKNLVYLHGNILWTPRFDHCHQCRSQALAVVEWLADKVDTIGVYGQVFDQKLRDEKWREVKRAVRNNDTTALQRMVLELKRGR